MVDVTLPVMEPEMQMSRGHKITNLIAVPAPLIALAVAVVLLWHKAVGPVDLIVMGCLYVATALGITSLGASPETIICPSPVAGAGWGP